MSLNREKYDLALHSLYECANNCDVAYVGSKNSKCNREYYMLDKLINEHFDNPPLKFEELKPNMWVWDHKDNKYNKIIEINNDKIGFYYITNTPTRFTCKYEENRFYRKQVEE